MSFDAVVLAGGQGRRLGGVSKPAITIGGRRLLDIALDALADAHTTVVVGATLPTSRAVIWTREDPAGGGPVAALAAGVPLVQSDTVVVLAADLPFITASAIQSLLQSKGDAVAAIAVDDEGYDQPLIACYDTARLRNALPTDPNGAAMRVVLAGLSAVGPVARTNLGGAPAATMDCDTAADLSRAQELA
jgi:molybdopterin-guanine dinucleotide biosynthesis protein A